jgi:hypothetical protein
MLGATFNNKTINYSYPVQADFLYCLYAISHVVAGLRFIGPRLDKETKQANI